MEKILKPMSGYLALIISLALLVAGGFLFVNGLSDENGTFIVLGILSFILFIFYKRFNDYSTQSFQSFELFLENMWEA